MAKSAIKGGGGGGDPTLNGQSHENEHFLDPFPLALSSFDQYRQILVL